LTQLKMMQVQTDVEQLGFIQRCSAQLVQKGCASPLGVQLSKLR
jgi:hypothetical protein